MLGQLHNGAIFQIHNVSVALGSDGQDGVCEPYSRGLNRIRVIAENPFDPCRCLIERPTK